MNKLIRAVFDDQEGFTVSALGASREAALQAVIEELSESEEDGAALVRANPDYISYQVVMETGTILPNGAVVLEFLGRVILAKTRPHEYVTWKWDGKDPRSTCNGNYWFSIANAAKDFESRSQPYGN